MMRSLKGTSFVPRIQNERNVPFGCGLTVWAVFGFGTGDNEWGWIFPFFTIVLLGRVVVQPHSGDEEL